MNEKNYGITLLQPDIVGIMESINMHEFSQTQQGESTIAEYCQKRDASLRINLDEHKKKNGLSQLVLTLIKLLHELLERQAIRRVRAGTLTDDEIEQVGLTLMHQAQEIERMRKAFGLDEEDLNLDLGPIGKLM